MKEHDYKMAIKKKKALPNKWWALSILVDLTKIKNGGVRRI